MAEYFEREALLDDISAAVKHRGMGEIIGQTLMRYVKRQPASDVAPVVHGRWVTHYRSGTPVAEGYVSTCCDMWNNRKSDYCPNCGAKMDGEKKDGGDSDACVGSNDFCSYGERREG